MATCSSNYHAIESADKYHMFTRKHYQVFEWTYERAKSVNYDTGLKRTRTLGVKITFWGKEMVFHFPFVIDNHLPI